jgi:hypothetical protein
MTDLIWHGSNGSERRFQALEGAEAIRGLTWRGSLIEPGTLTETFRGCDCIVHIAAWHGIHEDRGEKIPTISLI